MEFKQILREFLTENNLTQTAFAQKIGIKPSQVSEWLSGKAKPGDDNLKQMVLVFGVTADYFLGVTDEY